MSENKRGGARSGSGRKPKAPTTTINFRVPVDKVGFLKPLVSVYVKGLLAEEDQPPIAQVQRKQIKPVNPKATIKKNTAIKEPAKKFSLAEEMEKLRNEK